MLQEIGLDGTIFLRFVRTFRNLFATLAFVAVAILIPINISAAPSDSLTTIPFFLRISPRYLYGSTSLWAYVVIAYLFNVLVYIYISYQHRSIIQLKRDFYSTLWNDDRSEQRTVLVANIQRQWQDDYAFARLMPAQASTRIERDFTALEALIARRVSLERRLSKADANLADKYSVSERQRRKQLEQLSLTADLNKCKTDISILRATLREPATHALKQHKALTFGYVTFNDAANAQSWAYDHRNGGPQRSLVSLIHGESDLLWDNLDVSQARRLYWNRYRAIAMLIFSILWELPNAFIAIFIANVSHLSLIWPQFRHQLYAHPIAWGTFQGIVPPALSAVFYHFLPSVFRYLEEQSGSLTRTTREQHVLTMLLGFLTINHLLVFSLFSTTWSIGAAIIHASHQKVDSWSTFWNERPLQSIGLSIITITPYWCSWLLQRMLSKFNLNYQ